MSPSNLLSGQIAKLLNVGDIKIKLDKKSNILLSIKLNFKSKHLYKRKGSNKHA